VNLAYAGKIRGLVLLRRKEAVLTGLYRPRTERHPSMQWIDFQAAGHQLTGSQVAHLEKAIPFLLSMKAVLLGVIPPLIVVELEILAYQLYQKAAMARVLNPTSNNRLSLA
jgi:hypothetical protein